MSKRAFCVTFKPHNGPGDPREGSHDLLCSCISFALLYCLSVAFIVKRYSVRKDWRDEKLDVVQIIATI